MKKKLNIEKEFHEIMIKINRKFMLQRCELYKVRHRKNEDSLETLCEKYLNKLSRMKPWEIPEDENGNAGWINPDRILEDEAINLTLARLSDQPDEKVYEQRVRDLLKSYIREIEEIELIQKYKKYMPKK